MSVDINALAGPASALLVAVAGGGGLWAYLGGRGKTKNDLVTIATDAAAKVIKGLTDEIDRQDKRIADLELQDERCKKELAALKLSIALKPCASGPCPVEDAA